MTRSRTRRSCHLAVLVVAACGSELRTVRTGPHPPTAAPPVIVDSPPPPAHIEIIPPDPGDRCAWQDGRWEWVGRSWEWTPGLWIVAPRGCWLAPPEALWVPSAEGGLLYYLPARWYGPKNTACAPEPCR